MKCSSIKMKKMFYYHALLGLFAGAIISLCLHGLQKDGAGSVENVMSRTGAALTCLKNKIQDTFITLVVKLVHFFVAKSLQFRFILPLQGEPSFSSMLFWVALTRAVSSMSTDSLY